MLIAIFTDIHGNREAFEACLLDAKSRGANQYVFLGDYVGYGADPQWVVDRLKPYLDHGAIAVLGNHDQAIFDPSAAMNPTAKAAIDWTRQNLNAEAKSLLQNLPFSAEQDGRLYVHAEASNPSQWHYITDAESAWASISATKANFTFCGHVHIPAVYGITATSKLAKFVPIPNISVPLLRHRRWLCVLGSVGQPRDGIPAACYGIFDTESCEVTNVRVPYDVETAADKIRAAGLPESLADRLFKGR